MDHIGAAILFAQPVVDRSGVQQHGFAIAERVGGLQQPICWEIGNDKTVAAGERHRCLDDVLALLEPDLFEGEALIEELAGGVVVVDRETRTGNAVILRGLLDQGQFRFDAGVAEIADADLDRVGRERVGSHDAQADRTDQPSDHDSSLTFPLEKGLLA
jgi:hypothetical protein